MIKIKIIQIYDLYFWIKIAIELKNLRIKHSPFYKKKLGAYKAPNYSIIFYKFKPSLITATNKLLLYKNLINIVWSI